METDRATALPDRSFDALLAIVDASDRRVDDITGDAYRSLRKTYPDLEADAFDDEIAELLTNGYLSKTPPKRDGAGEVVRGRALVPTGRGRNAVESLIRHRRDVAIDDLSYSFVMLGEAIQRLEVMLLGHAKDYSQEVRSRSIFPGPDGPTAYEDPVVPTVSDSFVVRVESYVRPEGMPVEIPPFLTEFRAYYEWAMLLARRLSDAVSDKEKIKPTDVRLSDLVGSEPPYTLDPLPKKILDQINWHVTHHTTNRRPDFHLNEIEAWRRDTLGRLLGELELSNRTIAQDFHEYLAQYRNEIVGYG